MNATNRVDLRGLLCGKKRSHSLSTGEILLAEQWRTESVEAKASLPNRGRLHLASRRLVQRSTSQQPSHSATQQQQHHHHHSILGYEQQLIRQSSNTTCRRCMNQSLAEGRIAKAPKSCRVWCVECVGRFDRLQRCAARRQIKGCTVFSRLDSTHSLLATPQRSHISLTASQCPPLSRRCRSVLNCASVLWFCSVACRSAPAV